MSFRITTICDRCFGDSEKLYEDYSQMKEAYEDHCLGNLRERSDHLTQATKYICPDCEKVYQIARKEGELAGELIWRTFWGNKE